VVTAGKARCVGVRKACWGHGLRSIVDSFTVHGTTLTPLPCAPVVRDNGLAGVCEIDQK
jgi:hypothetical protein